MAVWERVFSYVFAMSTFKKSFAYAEALFRILDCASEGLVPIEMCEKFDWEFPGGTFGTRKEDEDPCPHEELPTSATVIPGGHMSSWLNEMRNLADQDKRGLDLYPEALRVVLRNRRRLFRIRFQAKASWISVAKYLTERSGKVFFGMTAVYELCHSILDTSSKNHNVRVSSSNDFKLMTREMYLGGSASSSLSLDDLDILFNIFHEVVSKLGVHYLTMSISKLESLITQCGRCRTDVDEIEVYDDVLDNEELGDDEVDWNYRSTMTLGRITVEVRPKCAVWRMGNFAWCLGTSDIRKVLAYITGVRNYLVGVASDAATSYVSRGNTLLRSASLIKKHLINVAKIGASLANGKHLELCKAYKACLAIVKAHIAGEMSTQYLPELYSDLDELSIYGTISDTVTGFINDAVNLPPTGALPLAKIYRLMPPPDVWIHDALRDRWVKASIIRNVGPAVCDEFRTALREVIMTARMRDKTVKLALRNPRNRPAWWDAYIERRYDDVPTDQLYDECVSGGTVEIVDRSRYDPTVWKDSGCGADTLEEALAEDEPWYKSNFLMRMIFDDSCPMPENDVQEGQGISKAGLKGESHKKRIFYSNNVASRMLQSKCDATVGSVMSAHPSFAIQKTGVERDDAFNELSSPPNSLAFTERVGIIALVCALYYSFDIKGWSESMPGDIQKTSHEVWDEFTNSNLFSRTSRNHDGAIVYCVQDGLTSWYTNGTANFEGYNGKEMTALHIAIMTIAVRTLRARLPDVDPRILSITLQAYIDDGLARLVLPVNLAMRVFNEWCNVVLETWARFGFTIERKKSFPSPAYFEFLGEEYFAGAHLATGSKAAMRITAEQFEVYESMKDRVVKLATACRGACVAGLPPPSAYLLQSYMVGLEVRKWVKTTNPTGVACWLMAPAALGGVGLPSLFQQATNASGATTEECMNTLFYWARHNDSVKQVYINIVRKGMMGRAARDVLAVPLGGQSTKNTMSDNPIGKKIIDKLAYLSEIGRLSGLGELMMSMGRSSDATEFAEDIIQLAPGSMYQEALLNDLSDPLPEKIYRSFISRFESARTINRFIRRQDITNTVRANRREARSIYAKFRAFVKVGSSSQPVTKVGNITRRGIDIRSLD